MGVDELRGSVREQTQILASWVRGADPALPVPSCPDWTLADLVDHVGTTQQWVATLVEDRITDPAAAFAITPEPAPPDPAAWGDWLRAGADRAVAAIENGAGAAEVFDPSGAADGVRFWGRRVFGEISVHRIDAALTVGRPYELEAPLAAAAIDDWLDTMSSPGWATNVAGFAQAMAGDGQTIAWVAEDADQSWLLRRGDAPLTLTRGDARSAGPADVTITGPAVDLLHVVSRRRALEEATTCHVAGHRAELVHLIDNMTWIGG